MPERVVDALKSVKVDEEDGDRRAGDASVHERPLQILAEESAVGEAGQSVVVGEKLRTVFGALTLRYLLSRVFD